MLSRQLRPEAGVLPSYEQMVMLIYTEERKTYVTDHVPSGTIYLSIGLLLAKNRRLWSLAGPLP